MTVLAVLRQWLDDRDPKRLRRYLVAYSGGMDSHVLLHALAVLRDQQPFGLVALHVNHGWSPSSDSWVDHCRAVCRDIAVDFLVHSLPAEAAQGFGREGDARAARYRWFASLVEVDDTLLLAHHRGDQAETLLYNLFRGAGSQGLAAMPRNRRFASGILARPLLDLPREALAAHARGHNLSWIDDPANFDTGFDRNFVRHRVLPVVAERWPAVEQALARAATNSADAVEILEHRALELIERFSLPDVPNPLSEAPVLDTAPLAALPASECFNVLRRWIAMGRCRAPSRRKLRELRERLLANAETRSGCIAYGGVEVRRYRGRLYLCRPAAGLRQSTLVWRIDRDLEIPGAPLVLRARAVRGKGVKTSALSGRDLTVDFDNLGRAMATSPGGPRKKLKNLFQEAGIPPFLRCLVPRICTGGELVAVPLVGESADYLAGPGEPGIEFELLRCVHPQDADPGRPGG